MNRRQFLAICGATTGGLLLLREPKRVYSFGHDVGWIQPATHAQACVQADGRIQYVIYGVGENAEQQVLKWGCTTAPVPPDTGVHLGHGATARWTQTSEMMGATMKVTWVSLR